MLGEFELNKFIEPAPFDPSLVLPHGLKSDYVLLRDHLLAITPSALKEHIPEIQRVSGTPFDNLLSGIVDCGTGLFLYAMGGTLAREFTALTNIQRYALAASPLLLGGVLRVVVAAIESDYGRGKEGIQTLLGTSLLGVTGIIILLSVNNDFTTITINDWHYWLFLICNILSGTGVAAYSAGMTLAAKAAPDDTAVDWSARLSMLSAGLSTKITPNFSERSCGQIVRKGPAEYMALVAGVSNLAPGLTLIISRSLLIPALGLRNTYIIFAALTLCGMAATSALTSNAVYDQLLALNPQLTAEKSKILAQWMGQTLFSPPATLFQTLLTLNAVERNEIALACINYTTTFGLLTAITTTGLLTLVSRGMQTTEATLTIAGVSLISSALRGLLSIHSCSLSPNTITNVSLLTMLVSGFVFALSPDQKLWTAMLYVFAVANGAGNFSIIAQIAQKVPDKVGLATGLSSGLAAFSAFPISIAFAWLASYNRVISTSDSGVEQTDTAIQYILATAMCAASLIANLGPTVKDYVCNQFFSRIASDDLESNNIRSISM